MYDRILYPTDGSTGAEAAFEHAQNLASTYGATVDVLSVIDTNDVGFGLPGEHHVGEGPGLVGDQRGGAVGMVGTRADPEDVRTDLRERGQALVDEVAAEFEGVETRTAVRGGEPQQVIRDYADEHDVDLVVMGTHGRTGVDRYLLGSDTEDVVRTADVPVVTARARNGR